MFWYSTPWTATPFSNDPLGLTLFVEGVNDCLLDHCQGSSIPNYCGFKEQDTQDLYCRDGHLMKHKCTFLRIDFFLLSWAVRSNKLNWNKKVFEMFYFRCNESRIYESFTFWNIKKKMLYDIHIFLDAPVCVHTHTLYTSRYREV